MANFGILRHHKMIGHMLAISTEALAKTYRSRISRNSSVVALQGLTLDVEAGQIFSLLGPNGAGKTTCIKILLTLAQPSSGKASVLGHDIPDTKIKSRIGYLPENHRFPGYLTGEQVLWHFGQLAGVPRSVVSSRIVPLLQLVGIAQWRTMKVKRYSKGMMQRLGLAQAMINEPDLVFLDEPTDGVDPVGRKEIRDVLLRMKDAGKTIFLNSHLLSEVELISDRVAILDKGKLLRVGTVEELTSNGSRYVIGIGSPLPESVRREAEAMVMPLFPADGAISAEVKTPHDLNRLIDLLRKADVQILSIQKQKSSLEDSFLSLLKQEGQA